MLTSTALRTGILQLIRVENKPIAALLRMDSRNYSCESTDKLKNEKYRTGVLLIHHGQPRTLYYAKEFVAASANQFYKIPRPIVSFLINLFWPFFQKIQFCVTDYKKLELLSTNVNNLAFSVEQALAELVPEFGSIRCVSAFQYEQPALTRTVKQFMKEGVNRLILLSLYPHYSCFQTGIMLNSAISTAYGDPFSVENFLMKLKGVEPYGSSSPCKVTAIYRWNTHPALINFWQKLIADKLHNHDSILFVALQMRGYGAKEYNREVWSSCERLMESLGNSHTWRLAFYSGWNQWPLVSSEGITWQLCLLRREKKDRTLVVPITSVIPNFDTEVVLPNLLVNKGVDMVAPPANSPILVCGLAEMVKNQLLGGGINAQLHNRCPFCVNPRCEYTKSILMRKGKPFK